MEQLCWDNDANVITDSRPINLANLQAVLKYKQEMRMAMEMGRLKQHENKYYEISCRAR